MFFINSVLLGIALSMDAFSISLANGLRESNMRAGRMCMIAGVFGIFHTGLPLIGWVVVHTAVQYLHAIEPFIPWIALLLLVYIGGGMVWGVLRGDDEDEENDTKQLSFGALLAQVCAASIDALSVGFTISSYGLAEALTCSVIIGAVAFIACCIGMIIGRKFGTRFSSKAELLGGVILVLIGIEIWVTGVLM